MQSYTDCPICFKKLKDNNYGALDAGNAEYSGTIIERYSDGCKQHHFESIITMDEQVISATVEVPIRKAEGHILNITGGTTKDFTCQLDLVMRVTNMYNEHKSKGARKTSSTVFIFPSAKFALDKAGVQLTGIDYSYDYMKDNTVEFKKVLDFDFPTLEKLKQRVRVYLTFS